MKVDFADLAPESRRIVLVCSDEKYRQLVNQIDWLKLLRLLFTPLRTVPFEQVVSTVLGPGTAGSLYLNSTWVSMGKVPASRSWFDVRKGEIPIPHLSPGKAKDRFRFDLGEPKDGVAYVLDPCNEDHYLVLALANERLAQEKLAAFVQIATALGAKTIGVFSGETVQQSAEASAQVPPEVAAAQIGLAVKVAGHQGVQRQVLMEFEDPERPPFVPAEAQGWIDMEPTLRMLVNTRLTARARKATVNLKFEAAVDINARIAGELAQRKISVGGEYRDVHASVWGFDIEFWPVTVRS